MVAKSNMKTTTNIVPLNADIVPVHGTVKSHTEKRTKELGPVHKYGFNFSLDFSKMSRADLIELATDTIVIRAQANARTMYHRPFDANDKTGNMGKDKKTPNTAFDKIAAKYMTGTVNVKEVYMSKVRARGKDKVTKTADMFAGMTPEQQAATLKQLQMLAKANTSK